MKSLFAFTVMAIVLSAAAPAFAWGGRGHAAICESAVFLVKEKGLQEYLNNKPQMMGHLCNIPDFYWRSLGGDAVSLGGPTHYIDVEITGLKTADVPTDFKKIVDTYTGKPNAFKKGATIFNVPNEFGSVWWRADQFYRRFLTFNKELQAATPPRNAKEASDDNLPYNRAAYDMSVSLGLMGHFVGDTSQPLHTTANFDGWANGHGGLHAYYEDDIVSQFDGDLQALVLKEARGMKTASFLKPGSVVEKMKRLSETSMSEFDQIFKLDPVITPSTVVNEKGLEIKTPAVRQSAAVGFKRMNKIIVKQLARSSLLLAQLWDQAYVEAGRPTLSASKLYRYPLTVEFIAPDYLPTSAAATPGATASPGGSSSLGSSTNVKSGK
jgi:hypothetical protein